MGRSAVCWGLAVLLAGMAFAACADVFRPAYLELHEAGKGRYEVMWKVPAQEDQRLSMDVRFPAGTIQLSKPRALFSDGAYVERWQVQRQGGLAGQRIRIEGAASGVTDVIVRVERQDGGSQTERLPLDRLEFTVLVPARKSAVAWSYLVLGVEHILGVE